MLYTSEEVRERIFPSWDRELVDTQDIEAVLEDTLNTTEDKKIVNALQTLLT